MPCSPNQQMFKLLLYFKLLSHYTEKIRQSLLLTVMMSAPASPCTGVVCLHLGKWAGRGRQWGVLLGPDRGKTDPSSTKSVRSYTNGFHSCAALLQTFCKWRRKAMRFCCWHLDNAFFKSMTARWRHLFKFPAWDSKQIWAKVWGCIFPAGSLMSHTRESRDK